MEAICGYPIRHPQAPCRVRALTAKSAIHHLKRGAIEILVARRGDRATGLEANQRAHIVPSATLAKLIQSPLDPSHSRTRAGTNVQGLKSRCASIGRTPKARRVMFPPSLSPAVEQVKQDRPAPAGSWHRPDRNRAPRAQRVDQPNRHPPVGRAPHNTSAIHPPQPIYLGRANPSSRVPGAPPITMQLTR